MNINGFKPASRLNGVGEYYFSKKLREISTLTFKGDKIINLGIGSPDMDPPESVINSLMESSRGAGSHMYQSYKGIPDLRKAFSSWYSKFFRVKLDPETQLLPLIGSKEGIMHISMTFIQDGDMALVPNPGYPAYSVATKLAGGIPLEYPLSSENSWLPDLGALEKLDLSKVKVMWINYPHMPTGAKASSALFKELISFSKRHNIVLVNDNPYSFILNDNPLSILESISEHDPVLELNSLSKSHNMAGWRVGVVTGNAEFLNHILRFKSNMDSGMFKPIMMAAVKALQEGQDWYDRINLNYAQRREYAWQLMDIIGCIYDKKQSGMFVWGKIPDPWKNGEELTDWLLANTGIFIAPGFIFGSQGDKYIRISLCNDLPVWEQVLKQVKETIFQKH